MKPKILNFKKELLKFIFKNKLKIAVGSFNFE